MKSSKILGLWSGHDTSFCILNDGRVELHCEYERFIRQKEPAGDSAQFFLNHYPLYSDISCIATCYPLSKLAKYKKSYDEVSGILNNNDGKLYIVGHHQAHAANAFYSSPFSKALIITIDGGGLENTNEVSACTVWHGNDRSIKHLYTYPINVVNIGGVWTRCTRYIFNLQSGWPLGHQAGTVMAMSALGNPDKYTLDFLNMFTDNIGAATFKPTDQPKGANTGSDPCHPYLHRWRLIAESSEQEKFNLAAGLQKATHIHIMAIVLNSIKLYKQYNGTKPSNICLSGGVALNSVIVGQLYSDFSETIEKIYVTPTPHDGGLVIGAAQFVWHNVMLNKRVDFGYAMSPYMGKAYDEDDIQNCIDSYSENIICKRATDHTIVNLLDKQKIIAVFNGKPESGKRALGNRSILADPRSPLMKHIVNEKVKHRQYFRPFAPSILKEEVGNWFVSDIDSPYMDVVLKFRTEMMNRVPAVVHYDGTGRLQTVTEDINPWYYGLLRRWFKKSGVPILLNTSFNDREPICEGPEDCLKCFISTNIDHVYFPEYSILLTKK